MSRFVRRLLCSFLVSLILLGTGGVITNKINEFKQEKAAIAQMQQERANQIKFEILKNKIQECGKLQVSKGTITSSYVYSERNYEVMSKERSNMLVALHKTLYNREISIDADYNYNVMYNLSDIKIDTTSGKPIVTLFENDIQITDVYTKDGTVDIQVKKGLAVNSFNEKEKQLMREFATHKVRNYLVGDNSVAKSSMNSLEGNIKKIANSLGIEDVVFVVYENKTLASQDDFTTIGNHTQSNVSIVINNDVLV